MYLELLLVNELKEGGISQVVKAATPVRPGKMTRSAAPQYRYWISRGLGFKLGSVASSTQQLGSKD